MKRRPILRQSIEPDFQIEDLATSDESFEKALLAGLRRAKKAIPCRFLYDAEGSALFDRICGLPEYYPTRTETAILETHAKEIAQIVGAGARLIELGSGSSVKTRILLDRLIAPACYMPIDVSREHLARAAEAVAGDYPGLCVRALVADYADDFALPDDGARRVAFFPGSTIGNLDAAEARALLSAWRDKLGADGLMIVGVDLKKDPRRLEAAYNDSAGVTEAFIKNILARANRELGADFDLSRFAYEARWSASAGRVEMHLRSRGAQTVSIAGRRVHLRNGERIHVENSHKYGLEEFATLARAAGFYSVRRLVDRDRLFCVHIMLTAV